MVDFIKYFWELRGNEADDVYVELSSEEGKKGSKGSKFVLTVGSRKVGDAKQAFGTFEEADKAFMYLYGLATNKTEITMG